MMGYTPPAGQMGITGYQPPPWEGGGAPTGEWGQPQIPQGYYGQSQTQPLYQQQYGTQGGTQYMGGFQPSPSFEWERKQAQRGLDMAGSARGNLLSGGHLKKTARLGSQMMATEWDRYMNRLNALSQRGQNAIGQIGSAGNAAAGQAASAYGNIGNAGAMGAIGAGNSWANAINGVGGALGSYDWGSYNPHWLGNATDWTQAPSF